MANSRSTATATGATTASDSPGSDDHPEEILDRLALNGKLAESEWGDLRQHLAACFPCAVQLRSPIRGMDASAAPAIDAQLDRRVVQTVMLRSGSGQSAASRRLPSLRRWAPIGIGTLLLSGTTLAATWWSVHRDAEVVASGPLPLSPGRPATRSGEPSVPPDGMGDPTELAPSPGASGVQPGGVPGWAALGPEGTLQRPMRSTSSGVPGISGRAHAGHLWHRPSSSTAQAAAPSTSPAASALFARARMERLAGQFDDALATYRRIQHAFPESRECRLSYLVAGRLLLDHARPDLAAVQFDSYLETRGAASEEALVGHATALRRMGRWSEEAGDWRKLLSEHPTSVYATRARARLGALDVSHTQPMDAAGKASRLSP